jgi:mannose-6-phosphate isomerase-like protein (cupin superfamily)
VENLHLEMEYMAGAATPPHVHAREDEAFLILEGRCQFHCAEEIFEGGRAALSCSRKGGSITMLS